MGMKQRRIKNSKLIQELKQKPCSACLKAPPSDVDHIKTRGSGGDDTINNCWPLCRKCHTLKGRLGLKEFTIRYPRTKHILFERGWYYDEFLDKWRRDDTEYFTHVDDSQ